MRSSAFSFTTRLTWTPAPPAQAAAQPSSPATARDGGGTASTSSGGGTAGRSSGGSENGGLFGVLSRIPRPFGGSADGAALLAAAPQAQIHVRLKPLYLATCFKTPFNFFIATVCVEHAMSAASRKRLRSTRHACDHCMHAFVGSCQDPHIHSKKL